MKRTFEYQQQWSRKSVREGPAQMKNTYLGPGSTVDLDFLPPAHTWLLMPDPLPETPARHCPSAMNVDGGRRRR